MDMILKASDPKMNRIDFLKRAHALVGKTDGINYN